MNMTIMTEKDVFGHKIARFLVKNAKSLHFLFIFAVIEYIAKWQDKVIRTE